MLHSVLVVRPSAVPSGIKLRWRAALMAYPCWSSPFLTPEFAIAVGAERQDARIIIARDQHGHIGILGVHKRPDGYARPLGAPVSDHQALITEPGFEADIADILKAAGLGALPFTGLNDPKHQVSNRQNHTTNSQIADLSAGPDRYFAQQREIHGRHFKKMRQRARAALRDHGTVELVLDSQAETDFAFLMQHKRGQYRRTRKCDVLASRWISALLHRLWQDRGRVRAVLNMLYLDGKPAAAEIGLYSEGTYHSWIAAYDPAFSRCSPGLLLLEGVMQNARKLCISRIDLGVGHEHYKKYYANDEITLGTIKVLGEGFIARQHHFIDRFGSKILAGVPLRLFNSFEFIAACHPSWRGKMRGLAGRFGQLVT
jgi:CelD/BcsL family acetyltransferase involved in cellulose biosynthesis